MTAPCRRRLRRAGCFSGLDQQPDKGGGQTDGQDSGNDRLQAQGDDLAAAVGRHLPHAADHDPKTAEIGGAAQRIGHDQTAMVAQRARRQARYRQVGNELVKHDLGAQQGARGACLGPRYAYFS